MPENVIFDNQDKNTTQSDQNPNQPQDPQAIQETGQEEGQEIYPQAGEGGEGEGGEPPQDNEPPSDETEEEALEPEKPPGIIERIRRILLRSESNKKLNEADTGSSKKLKIILFIIAFVVIIVIIILVIPKGQQQKDVTLTWWGLWEDAAVIQPVIDEFERKNPQIKIKYTKQDSERYRDTLVARINNGTGPDIFRYHNTWVPTLNKTLAPLSKDVISVADFNKAYYPVIQNDLIRNGAIYGVPLGIDSIALFVNRDLLTNAGLSVPQDWNQFVSAAKNLTVRNSETDEIKIAGAALGTYGNINHAPDIISVLLLQQGVDVKKIGEAQDNLSSALAFYTSFSRGDDAVWDKTMENARLEFSRGNVAMYFGFSWDIFLIEQYNTEKKVKYSIYPVPSLVVGDSKTIASYWVEGVSVRGKNQKEAMKFMQYLTQKETLQKLYTESSKTRQFGEPYPRVDMADELKDNPMVYPFINQLGTAGSSYFASDTNDGDTGLNQRANKYLENAINTISGFGSAQGEAKKLQEGVTKILKEYGIQ